MKIYFYVVGFDNETVGIDNETGDVIKVVYRSINQLQFVCKRFYAYNINIYHLTEINFFYPLTKCQEEKLIKYYKLQERIF
jgi:hypothetical protein